MSDLDIIFQSIFVIWGLFLSGPWIGEMDTHSLGWADSQQPASRSYTSSGQSSRCSPEGAGGGFGNTESGLCRSLVRLQLNWEMFFLCPLRSSSRPGFLPITAHFSERDRRSLSLFIQEVAHWAGPEPRDSFCSDDINKLQRKSSQTFPCFFCSPTSNSESRANFFFLDAFERLLLTDKAETLMGFFVLFCF